ncbi:GSCOCG00006382001-RA-CDS [Cotesia congregata]|nr:GSCOCG00006382001-RA-CDS [Cotesia congregata]
MNFAASTFSLNGQFKSTNQWNPSCSFFENIRFGVNAIKECKINAKELLNSNIEILTPYLTKFFTVDSVTGFAVTSSGNSTFLRAPEPSAIRYLKSMTVHLALIHAGLKTWRYCKKNCYSLINVSTLLLFFINLFEAIGNALLFVSTASCIYYFIFYKGQTVLHILLPDDYFELIIKISTIVAFGGKVIGVLYLIYRHRNVNIFFVDWEQSRQSSEGNKILLNENDTENIANDKWLVSVWRIYFVISQWLRIKTKRKTSVSFQIFSTIFILEVIGLKMLGLAVPDMTMTENKLVDHNFTMQYAVGVIIYVVVYLFQLMLVNLYEKYVKNSLQGFVDLCSVANISLLIFTDDYYGYYIHGRSVHGFADTDLMSLISDLQREENNLCAHRGLIPGTTEQTFVVCISRKFRVFYNALLGSINSNARNFSRRHFSKLSMWNERCKTHLKLRKFLCGFLDHCYVNIDYIVKERCFLEKLCDIELVDTTDKTVFYIDNNYSFDTIIFHGNEWALATFELSTFLFTLVLGHNYILSAIFTIFLSQLLALLAKFNQSESISRKTLIDERFLM